MAQIADAQQNAPPPSADTPEGPPPPLTAALGFGAEVSGALELLFVQWLAAREASVRAAAAEAVGALVRLLTEVQLRPLLPRLLPGLVAAVKKERDWEVSRVAQPCQPPQPCEAARLSACSCAAAQGVADDAQRLGEALRAGILRATGGCTASVGIGPNRLLARLATARAKPDGLRRLRAADAAELLRLSLIHI